MKNFLLSSAVIAALPSVLFAQTEMSADNVPAFLSSNFVGMSLHAVDTEEARALSEERTQAGDYADSSRMGWMSGDIFAASRDQWNDIGAVEDVVLTQDGDMRGVLVDIGGFLGMGARTVLIDFADLYMVPDNATPDRLDDFLVVSTFSKPELEAMPEWDAAELSTGYAQRALTMGTMAPSAKPEARAAEDPAMMAQDKAGQTEPMMGADADDPAAPRSEADQMTDGALPMSEGYSTIELTALSADKILGADIYDVSGDSVGTVSDLVLDENDGVSAAVVDIGGFLGIGARTVALPIEEAAFKINDVSEDLRIDTVMTREQFEVLPEYAD